MNSKNEKYWKKYESKSFSLFFFFIFSLYSISKMNKWMKKNKNDFSMNSMTFQKSIIIIWKKKNEQENKNFNNEWEKESKKINKTNINTNNLKQVKKKT